MQRILPVISLWLYCLISQMPYFNRSLVPYPLFMPFWKEESSGNAWASTLESRDVPRVTRVAQKPRSRVKLLRLPSSPRRFAWNIWREWRRSTAALRWNWESQVRKRKPPLEHHWNSWGGMAETLCQCWGRYRHQKRCYCKGWLSILVAISK